MYLYGAIAFGVVSALLFVLSFAISKKAVDTSSQNQKGTEKSFLPFVEPSVIPTFISTQTPVPTLIPLPVSKILPGGYQVFQTFNNCGPASLSMTLSHFGIQETKQTLGQQIRPYQNPQGDNDDKSVTLAELAQKGEEYNLIAYHRPAGDIEVLKRLIANDLPVITRTWLKPGDDIGHYRVVKGYDEAAGVLIQDDSLQGANLRYSYNDFLDLWEAFNYEYLVLVSPDKKQLVENILGDSLDEKNAWSKALDISERELVNDPTNIYAQFNKSVALYHLGKFSESVEAFEQVQSRLPMRMLWYQIEPVLAYYQLGEDEKVLQITNQILSNHNRAFSELYDLQQKIYIKRGDQVSAVAAAQNAVRYNGGNYWKANIDL